jgi:hypothetical protein
LTFSLRIKPFTILFNLLKILYDKYHVSKILYRKILNEENLSFSAKGNGDSKDFHKEKIL